MKFENRTLQLIEDLGGAFGAGLLVANLLFGASEVAAGLGIGCLAVSSLTVVARMRQEKRSRSVEHA